MVKRKEDYPVHINYPLKIADTFISRLIGLMGKKNVDYGLLLIPCKSIHTLFMKIPIDVVFLDKNFTVISVHENVTPWKNLIGHRNTYSILELPAGQAGRLKIAAGEHI